VRRWLVGLTALTLLAGCGGGGGSEFLTREAEASLDPDALALASREATGLRVPLSLARRIDADLREARAAFPALQGVRAQLDNDPRTLHVIVSASAPWRTAWESGQWRTGVPAVDTVLAPLNVASVRTISINADTAVFDLTFDQWVRTKAVAFTLFDKSPSIQSVSLVPPPIGSGQEGDLQYALDGDQPAFSGATTSIHRVGGVWRTIEGTP
jgi:hypothetical protein